MYPARTCATFAGGLSLGAALFVWEMLSSPPPQERLMSRAYLSIKLSSALVAMLGLLLAPSIALAVCGDGVVDTGETCDDLNTTSGDGCDASCQPEAGWTCAPASFALDFNEVLYDDGTPPVWTVSTDGLTVYQSQNASPAIYGSTLPAPGVTIGFTLSVQTSADDDFIGWSIGYEQGENVDSNADWLLFDWKQADQGFPRGLPDRKFRFLQLLPGEHRVLAGLAPQPDPVLPGRHRQ